MPRRSSEDARRHPQKQICLKLDPDVYHVLQGYCKIKGKKVNRFISDLIESNVYRLPFEDPPSVELSTELMSVLENEVRMSNFKSVSDLVATTLRSHFRHAIQIYKLGH